MKIQKFELPTKLLFLSFNTFATLNLVDLRYIICSKDEQCRSTHDLDR